MSVDPRNNIIFQPGREVKTSDKKSFSSKKRERERSKTYFVSDFCLLISFWVVLWSITLTRENISHQEPKTYTHHDQESVIVTSLRWMKCYDEWTFMLKWTKDKGESHIKTLFIDVYMKRKFKNQKEITYMYHHISISKFENVLFSQKLTRLM